MGPCFGGRTSVLLVSTKMFGRILLLARIFNVELLFLFELFVLALKYAVAAG